MVRKQEQLMLLELIVEKRRRIENDKNDLFELYNDLADTGFNMDRIDTRDVMDIENNEENIESLIYELEDELGEYEVIRESEKDDENETKNIQS